MYLVMLYRRIEWLRVIIDITIICKNLMPHKFLHTIYANETCFAQQKLVRIAQLARP